MHLIRGKLVHFPRKNGENGGRINIFGGKVPGSRGNLVHFPGLLTPQIGMPPGIDFLGIATRLPELTSLDYHMCCYM